MLRLVRVTATAAIKRKRRVPTCNNSINGSLRSLSSTSSTSSDLIGNSSTSSSSTSSNIQLAAVTPVPSSAATTSAHQHSLQTRCHSSLAAAAVGDSLSDPEDNFPSSTTSTHTQTTTQEIKTKRQIQRLERLRNVGILAHGKCTIVLT